MIKLNISRYLNRKRMLPSIFSYFTGSRISPASDTSRQLATNNKPIPDEIVEKFHPKLKVVIQQLDSIAPRFLLKSNKVEILTEPSEFYETLKKKIASSRERIFLSSLYIGKTQTELIDCISNALKANSELKVYFLIDALRGTREAPHNTCSASLVVQLVEKFGKHRVDVRLYHTPHLNGLTKSWVPKRINEGWGLQHMKLYGFDEEIILSGANLSTDYFTDRQDRYYVFKSKSLTDYYFEIQKAISSLSYQLLTSTKKNTGFRLDWPTSNLTCEPHLNLERFLRDSSHFLEPLLKQQKLKNFEQFKETDDFDTVVYPISNFTPLMMPKNDHSTEKKAIMRLISYLDTTTIKWWFTAGYFNMLPSIQDKLINAKSPGTIITASQQANSFYKSAGLSYYIPQAYLLFAKRFLEHVSRMKKEDFIKLFEWKRGIVNTPGGWSYHAKGLWITTPEEDEPSVTIIGSSNYTKRGYTHDLESNALVITKDPKLKADMRNEIDNIMSHVSELKLSDFELKRKTDINNEDNSEPTYEIDEDRRISYKVYLAVKFLGGKL